MIKLSLLEIIQDVLSSASNDAVTDVGETEDSEQILKIAKSVYYEMMARADWPHLKSTKTLEGLGDSAKPAMMKVPADIVEIQNIKYDTTQLGETQIKWTAIDLVDKEEFLDRIYERDSSATYIQVMTTADGIPIFIRNDQGPSYCTTFDDVYLIFDAFDSAVDTTLIAAKSQANVIISPTWTNSNSFIPNMPPRMFPTYLAKVRALAHELLEQRTLDIDAADGKRGLNRLTRKTAISKPVLKRNYGRK